MQNNEFYRGVLQELRQKQAAGPALPAPKLHTTPADMPSMPKAPAPLPAANPGANITPQATAPTAPVNNLSSVNPAVSKAFFPGIEKSLANVPMSQWPSRMQQYLNNPASSPDNPIATGTFNYVKENWAHPIDAYRNIQSAKAALTNWSKLAPADQLHQLYERSSADPTMKHLYDTVSHKAVDESIGKMQGMGDIWNAMTGKTKDPLAEGAFKDDPALKQYATNKVMGRAGNLAGDWLKNNWGKLAIGVGGTGALLMLLKSFMGGGEQQQATHAPLNNAPKFL